METQPSQDPLTRREHWRLLRARTGELQRRFPLMQLIAACALFAYGAASLTGFASLASIKTLLVLASLLGISAIGQTIVILLGGFDLAVPGFIALGNLVIAQLVANDHWPFVAALALLLAIAIVAGGLTGFLCNHFQAQPLIVTLGTGSIAVGVALVWTGGVTVSGTLPSWLSRLTSPVAGTAGIGIPPVIVIWALAAVVVSLFLHRTITGKRIYAAGANPVAARHALVGVTRLWAVGFAISAVSAVVVGVLLAGFSGAGDPNVGNNYLFISLSAVIVGGTSLIGARGDYWCTVVGALLLTELQSILIGHGFDQADQQILYGVVILLVVPAYGRDRRAGDRV
ncbi:MAG TPA: ABC transporter permease [Solirubrobacteraceae bacterium]